MAVSEHTNYISTRTGGRAGQEFDRAALVKPIPPILRGLMARLERSHYIIDDQDRMIIPLSKKTMTAAPIVVDEVQKNPALKPYILFYDGQSRRTYDDVVFDIEKNPVLFARMIDQERGRVQPLRVIITSAVLGYGEDRSVINCRNVMMPGSPVGDLVLMTRLQTKDVCGQPSHWNDVEARRGAKQIIQTDNITLTGFERLEMRSETDQPLYLNIEAHPGCIRLFTPPIIKQIAPIYDRTI